MNKTFLLFPIFFLLFSCHQKSFQEQIDDVRDEYSKQAEIQNKQVLSWEKIIDSINILADTNQILAIKRLDTLIKFDTALTSEKLSDLHFIKGDIYYNVDSFTKAIDEFSFAAQRIHFESPKILAANAGAYTKLKQYDTALNELKQAADINYDYYWNIGNFYEIVRQKDSALLNYKRLYVHDTIVYNYCETRIRELKKNKPIFLDKLIYKDRERPVLLMHGMK